MDLGSIVGDVIDSVSGAESHSTIEKFMSKFNNSAQHYVDQIDTLNSFDCKFEFYPGDSTESKKGFGDKMLDMAKDAGMNLLNNATGGLAEKVMNAVTGDGILQEQQNFHSNGGKVTFMNYLIKANLIDVEQGPNYVMDMSYYIQNIQTPNINIQTGENVKTPVGQFTVTGDSVIPQANTLQMEILNTKAPIIERIFYPWMKEVALPTWSYASQPYTTADITVSMTKHADVRYIFVNARPVNIDTYNPSQELNGSPTRGVTFIFDYMFIDSELETMQSLKDSMLGMAKGAINDVAGAFGL